ncbi:MAG: OmpA family protein [Deltaproteobacteria bacterium]|nr:OmpA family protein [Deltaproteobacteria bacterium]
MKAYEHRILLSQIVSCLVLAAPTMALAQSAQDQGWALNRFEPAPAGDSFFASEHPRTPATGAGVVRVGILGDYALRPLVFTPREASGTNPMSAGVVDHLISLRLQASVDIQRRLGLNFDMPFAVPVAGSLSRALQGGVIEGFSVGDPRFGARLRLAGEADRTPLSVYLGAQAFFGFLLSSQRSQLVTDEALRGRAYLTLAGRGGPVRWSLSTGYHARPRHVVQGAVIASELYLNAGVSVALMQDRLSVGAEAWVQTLAETAFASGNIAAEVIAIAKYAPCSWLELSAGVGPGITRAVGVPSLRGLVGVTLTPFDGSRVPQRTPADDDAFARAESSARSARAERNTPSQDPVNIQESRVALAPCSLGAPCDPATLDADHDGILLPVDQCPNEPAGSSPDPERPGCPDGDQDHDGVTDHRDECRTEPQGSTADPLHLGCPLQDRDGDNVADRDDHCPDVAGAPSRDPARNGCPSLVQMSSGELRILQPVFFDTGRATIQRRSFEVLQAVADALAARTDVRRLSVNGHTDSRGNLELNVDLSVRRATAVMLWLAEHGVEPQRLEAHGFGPTQPIADNATADGRERNRRVAFRVLIPAPTEPAAATPPVVAPAAVVPATSPARARGAVRRPR